MQTRKLSIAVKLLVAAFSTLISLLLLEGAIRLLGLSPEIREIGVNVPDSSYRRCQNPILGYELRPGARTFKSQVNSLGLFGVERPVKKPPGTRRVILLGDSILEPEDMATDELMNSQLEKLYDLGGFHFQSHQASYGRTEVLNLGVGGYNTLMEVEALRVKGLRFDPDIVVMIFVENDFDNVACEMAVLSRSPRPALVNWAFRRLHLFRFLCVKLDWFGFRSDADPIQTSLAAIGTNNVAKALPLFKELSVQYHFQPWIAIWPRFEDKNVTDVHLLGDRSTLVIEALARMSDIPTYRLSEFFNSHLQSRKHPVNPRLEFTYGDGMHPNAEGVRIAARALKSMLDTPHQPDRSDPSARKLKGEIAARMAQVLGVKGLDYTAALLQFAKWMEETKDDPDYLLKAVRYYEAVLSIDTNNFDAHCGLGRVFLKSGDRGAALKHFRHSLQVRPHDPGIQKLIQELSARADGLPSQ
jgi:lysophospholipase L1-like esterase